MKSSLLTLCCLAALGTNAANAEQIWLVCTVTNNPFFEAIKDSAPEAAVKTFFVDTKAKSLRQVTGMFKDDRITLKEWAEGQIRFEQPGINAPQFAQLQEVRTTLINRVTGTYTQLSEYRDSNGHPVFGEERDRLEVSSGRAGVPLSGVKKGTDTGTCETRKKLL